MQLQILSVDIIGAKLMLAHEISAAQFDLKPTGQLNLLQKSLPFIGDTKFTFNEPLSKQMNFVIKNLHTICPLTCAL